MRQTAKNRVPPFPTGTWPTPPTLKPRSAGLLRSWTWLCRGTQTEVLGQLGTDVNHLQGAAVEPSIAIRCRLGQSIESDRPSADQQRGDGGRNARQSMAKLTRKIVVAMRSGDRQRV